MIRKYVAPLFVISLLVCSGCGNYGDAYDRGYADGVTEALDNQALDYVRDNYDISEVYSNDVLEECFHDWYSVDEIYSFDEIMDYITENYLDEMITYLEDGDYLTEHGFVVLDEDEVNEYNLNDMLNSTTYIGNAGSMKFHRATCSSVMDIDEKNKIYNDSYDYFIENGYDPCKKCNP